MTVCDMSESNMADAQRQAARAITSTITVLVHLGQYTRPVSVRFDTGRCFSAMMEAIRRSFQDVLAQQEFFMQIKREEWGGAFVDVSEEEEIADRSIMKVVLKPVEVK